MKSLHQLSIILAITFLAEIIKYFLPFPIPSSIYGMVILLVALKAGWIPLEKIKDTGEFFIEIMPIMFIPAAVGLIVSFKQLDGIFIPVTITIIITTFIVSAVTGVVSQWVIRFERRRSK
jgi:holin-like protein